MSLQFLLVMLLALPLRAEDSADADDWSPRVTAVSGDVTVFEKGSEEGLPAEAETPLEDGDRIEVGEGAAAEVALEPDSLLELGEKTSFTVGSTAREASWFSLDLGSFVAKLKSFAEGRSRLEVRTPTAVAAVRGTEFAVQVGEDGATDVAVYDEGKVAVTASEDGGGETLLSAQKELTLRRGERAGKPHALKRMKARRERLVRLRERRAQLRKNWRRMNPNQRREARQRWLGSMRERMKNMPPKRRQQFKKRVQKAGPRKGPPHPPRRGGRP